MGAIAVPAAPDARWQQCTRKHGFKTRDEAVAALRAWRDRITSKRARKRVHFYHCEWCTGFHLGHKSAELTPQKEAARVP